MSIPECIAAELYKLDNMFVLIWLKCTSDSEEGVSAFLMQLVGAMEFIS